MSLTLRKRHTAGCRSKNGITEYQHFLRCDCHFWAIGTLRDDGFVRVSTKESKLDLAELTKRQWEERGTVAVIAKKEPAPDEGAVKLDDAITSFRGGYIQAKKLKQGTVRTYDTVFRFMEKFASDTGLRYVKELDLAALQSFQATWKLAALAASKRLTHLKTFLNYCVDMEYVASNQARKLRAPESQPTTKEPFSDDEMGRILEVAKNYPTRNRDFVAPRMYGLCLLLRYSGLRISDALSFSPERLSGNNAYLRTKKTGEPVSIWLPDIVIDALKGLTLVRGRYFWTPSTNELESVRKAWSRLFKTVFKNAGPFTSKPHIHRFRHTCACSLLVKGVSVDDVAAVLGHSDPQITLRYYSRWVKVRQDRLNSILKEAWEPESKEFRVIEGGKPAEKPAKAHHAATTKQRR